MIKKILLTCLSSLVFVSHAHAENKTIDLVVDYKTAAFADKQKSALAVNDQIPGPTLHFKEGDHVTINVKNHLREETAMHWHGILVPWQMDGVLGISQKGIPPGGRFQYQFTLHQSGTYWYHAHAGLQEQQGLYGAFIVDPLKHPTYSYNKDYVVVLSDWSNTKPEQILANLKKSGEYYAPRFPLQASLAKFIHDYQKASTEERQQLKNDYSMMQQSRMGLYDLSDVAYDAFLLNGQTKTNPWKALVSVGDKVRLRFIGAAGSTIFHVKIPGTSMQMVHVQGNDVEPYDIEDFTISPGETYDVIVKINKPDPVIIYAESIDTLGTTIGALVTSPTQTLDYRNIAPFPEPLPVSRSMMSMMMNDMHDGSSSIYMDDMPDMPMEHHATTHAMPKKHSHNMAMPTEPSRSKDDFAAPTTAYKTSTGTKYENVTAAVATNDPNKPIKAVINMELFGYMDRYIWFINGVPEYLAKPIRLEPSQRYRIVFTNNSMMRHPMHIHGHWFILRKDDGAHDPLLHTIEVEPGATITADVDTEASGQWFFHCHLLYHMITGMSRVFQYSTLIDLVEDKIKPENVAKNTAYYNRPIVRIDEVRPLDKHLVEHPMAHAKGFYFSNMLDIGAGPFNNVQRLTYRGLFGPDYNKLELFTNDAETNEGKVENADIDIFYWHLLNQFWAVKAGTNYTYRPASKPYWQPGVSVEGLMPYFIDTDLRFYERSGSTKLDAEFTRDTQITNNFFIRAGLRGIFATKTIPQSQIGSGLNQLRCILRPYYRLLPGLSIFAEYEYQQNYGSFKNLQITDGESAVQNTFTLGLSMLF